MTKGFKKEYDYQRLTNVLFKLEKHIRKHNDVRLGEAIYFRYQYYDLENNTYKLSNKELKHLISILKDWGYVVKRRKKYGYIIIDKY
ncbi:hypothetical protein EKQ61_11175 [Staphylococcus gallinarum]|uniref:Phage protein n=1 Tax=Staphylococcus gallinarum TaxID=1293 RepID=A0ABQ0Y6G1_STAGA|nr:hypothetical protein [Staphylococcus gallinarum]KIR10425.1 hypothetical protein SH09_13285 [Staphylococcus gallinarum]RTX73498.1 hypothetical protein EKQ61_11175 [Staphylococcus gallinarum]GEQ06990.1 hypothetical protein SGA02_28180 [Staphylococcus gallinarum]